MADLRFPQRNSWRGKRLAVLLVCGCACLARGAAEEIKVNPADGFDFPVGKPNAEGYYKSRGVRLRAPFHFGEDWNGRGGGDTDFGDPIYAIGDGICSFAYNVGGAWGNVVITRHAYRDVTTGTVKFIDALHGHLQKIMVKTGQPVKRGQQIATLGNNFGMYPAHLHFEIRHDLTIGMTRTHSNLDFAHWAQPSDFINQHRRLVREWKPVPVPTGTYEEYKGFKGL